MRLTRDAYMMALAQVAAAQTTCRRRAVGCVLTDIRGVVLAIAYNGVASGLAHCTEGHACAGSELPTGQDSCEAVHAEQNALLQCANSQTIHSAYVTLSPCKSCLKLLINTSCKRIIVAREWDDPWPKQQWLKLGREWIVLGVTS